MQANKNFVNILPLLTGQHILIEAVIEIIELCNAPPSWTTSMDVTEVPLL